MWRPEWVAVLKLLVIFCVSEGVAFVDWVLKGKQSDEGIGLVINGDLSLSSKIIAIDH